MTDILDKDADLSPYFGIDCNDNSDGEVMLLWNVQKYVESMAKKHVRHGIIQQTHTEFQRRYDISRQDITPSNFEVSNGSVYSSWEDSSYGEYLQLNNGFVRSITNLWEDSNADFGQQSGDFGNSTLLTLGTDYHLELDETGMSRSGRVIRNSRSWSSKPGTIKITYVAGFTAAELNDEYAFVKMALLEEIKMRFNIARAQRSGAYGPVKKETYFGDYQAEYAVDTKTIPRNSLSFQTMSALHPIVSMVVE